MLYGASSSLAGFPVAHGPIPSSPPPPNPHTCHAAQGALDTGHRAAGFPGWKGKEAKEATGKGLLRPRARLGPMRGHLPDIPSHSPPMPRLLRRTPRRYPIAAP
eukprot:360329-Chlamydomonas_euryale.AAC.13